MRFRSSSSPYCSHVIPSMPGAAFFFRLKKTRRRLFTVIWCRSAVSFSFLFLVTASRMRACAGDTISRLCVRLVLCRPAFLLAPSLPSTGSAAGSPVLFAGFVGTVDGSDSSIPFIIGSSMCFPEAAPCTAALGGNGGLPVPAQEISVHAKVFDAANRPVPHHFGPGPCCLLRSKTHGLS